MGSAVATTIIPASSEAGTCAHCGLGVRSDDRFCCYGCELASEIVADARDDHGRVRGTLTFGLILAMSVMMLSLFLYAEDIYRAELGDGLGWMRSFYRWASMVLATPVLALCGIPVLRRAYRRAREGRLSMSALIGAGALAAYGLSVYAVFTGGRAIYFDSATAALVLATLGRYLEASARTQASGILGRGLATNLAPVAAEGADGAPIGKLDPQKIEPGMRITVPADGVVPVDVSLLDTVLEVDLAVLSGESTPVVRHAGDLIPAGAVPVSGALRGEARSDARGSTLERLEAQARSLRERPSVLLRIADRFAAVLTPLVWGLALLTLAYWAYRAGIEVGVVNALAVVLVACPCTYAIAAPLVHWLAMRAALAQGVLVRHAEALEGLADVRTVAFDKTGTLTRSELEVTALDLEDGVDRAELLSLVAAMEAGNPHPVGRALARYAEGATPAELAERRFIPGVGVEARLSDGTVLTLRAGDEARARVVLDRGGRIEARFAIDERLRAEAAEAVDALKALGAEVQMLTGDSPERAQRVAETLAIPFAASLGPHDKVSAVEAFPGGVLMVGDGINDAPALAGVATSVAMGEGSGLSRSLAQVNLLTDDLRRIPWVIDLARRARRRTRVLLITATAYNSVFLTLAAVGLLRPVWAGVSMLISSLLTILAAVSISAAGAREEKQRGAAMPQGARS